ncbi:MAG TPA: hypothetical protein VIT65_22400 [Microlunatus sp.]
MPATPTIEQVFAHIDAYGDIGSAAGAELSLNNGQHMTVQAGGDLVEASPFAAYTVFLDHDPPRFWKRFGNDDPLIYLHVPRLLVTHHIIRHGGAHQIMLIRETPPTPAPLSTIEEVRQVLEQFLGRPIQPGVLH